jgi:hypothetical protein
MYESLADELGLKTALLASPLKSLKQIDVSHYLVNVGLTLKELTKEARPLLPNINVLPAPYQPRQVSMNQLLSVPAVAVAIALVVMMVMTVQDTAANIASLNNQVITNNSTIEKNVTQKKILMRGISDLEAILAATDYQYAIFSNAYIDINKTGDLMNNDLYAAVDNVVDELNLEMIMHSGSQILLDGNAPSEQLVLDYVRNLLSTGRFSEITIVNIMRSAVIVDEDEIITYSFSLKCYLKDGRS